MRNPLTFDDVEGLEFTHRTPDAHRRAASMLAAWAVEQHPDDEVTPADLLSAAAWHLDQAGDTEAGLSMHRQAVDAEGMTTPAAACTLHAALLEAGHLEEARQVAERLRRSRPRIVDFATMAENFELAGDLEQAHRWVNMGLNRLDLGSATDRDPEDYEIIELLDVRRRIRGALGFPPDDLDDD